MSNPSKTVIPRDIRESCWAAVRQVKYFEFAGGLVLSEAYYDPPGDLKPFEDGARELEDLALGLPFASDAAACDIIEAASLLDADGFRFMGRWHVTCHHCAAVLGTAAGGYFRGESAAERETAGRLILEWFESAVETKEEFDTTKLKVRIEQEMVNASRLRAERKTALPDFAIWLGGNQYSIAGEEVTVSEGTQAEVLQAAVELGGSFSASDLTRRSGITDAARSLRTFGKSEHPLAKFIICPGGKGKGGYRVHIRKTQTEPDGS